MATSGPVRAHRRPLRVLWLIKGLGPGGAERLLVNLARVIDRDAVTPEAAYLLAYKDQLVAELADAGVASVCLHGASAGDVRWAARLRRLVVDHSIDIVHIHAPYPAAVARPVLRALGRRRPAIVYTEHNAWGGYGRVTRWANAATYPLDDARMAVSADAQASIARRWRAETEVLVHGIDLDLVGTYRVGRARARAELGVDNDTILVGTVANLRHHKDYPTPPRGRPSGHRRRRPHPVRGRGPGAPRGGHPGPGRPARAGGGVPVARLPARPPPGAGRL